MAKLAEIIEHHRAAILARWAISASRLAAARGLSKPDLMNVIPIYLSSLASLNDGDAERKRLLEVHVSSRLRAGYRLDEVLEEISILGRCLRPSQPPTEDDPLSPDEVARLYDALHQDSALVISAFTRYLMEDEQEEKRFLRRLQEVAHEALRSPVPGVAFEARLPEVMEIVMEAVSAQCASLVVYDREGGSLCVNAAAGDAGAALTSYAISTAPERDPGEGEDQPQQASALNKPTSNDPAMPEALREAGVRAVLGVRLPERLTMRGVMYVGVTTPRTFLPRELQRLEALGDHLSLHLDNARLHADLRAVAADLRLEHDLRERFISVLMHDLRGPLSVAQVGAHILCTAGERAGERDSVPPRILRNVKRAITMVDDLLDVMRIRAGQGMPVTVAACDLADVARATVDELTALHGPRFVLRCDDSVTGDWSAEALHRALWNLATNAVKYGSAEASVEVTVRAVDDARVEVAVHNEGPVIDPETSATLFKPFVQLSTDPAGQRHGWGLGLTLVQSCAEAHGGSVRVESVAERGTTFTLSLPRGARAPEPLREAPSGDARSSPTELDAMAQALSANRSVDSPEARR